MKRTSRKHRQTGHSKLPAAACEPLEARRLMCALHTDERADAISDSRGDKGILIDHGGVGGGDHSRFNASTRWTSTATNGSNTGIFGDGITLTWSIVPDGTPLGSEKGEANTGSSLISALTFKYLGSSWVSKLEEYFNLWGAATGVTYIRVSDDGASFPGSPGEIGKRGDVRIGAHPIDGVLGSANTLAYNFFPGDGGDMVMDSEEILVGALAGVPFNEKAFLNTITHEHGHGLGISHVCPMNQSKLMEPFLSTAFTGPQFDDILGAQRLYGDRDEKGQGNGEPARAVNLGTNPTLSRSLLSLSNTSDRDYYKFNLTSVSNMTIGVIPTGGTYLSGAQNPDGSCSGGTSFNATAQANLHLRLLGADETPLAVANATGTGGMESITFPNLGAGTYYIEVIVAPGTTGGIQMYQLGAEAAPTAPDVAIEPVSPDTRINPVHSMQINFNQAVNGFELADLILSRDGQFVPLTGATLTTTNNINFTLSNLDAITDRVGVFQLRLIGAAGTNITSQNAGLPLIGDFSESWLMQGLNLTESDDYVRLVSFPQLSSTFVIYNEQNGYAFTTATPMDLVINGYSGNDIVILDFASGPMLPPGTLTVHGGANSDQLFITGTAVADNYASHLLGANFGAFNGNIIGFDAIESLAFILNAGNDVVSVTNSVPGMALAISGGDGDDDFTVGGGNLDIFGGANAFVDGGAGDDRLWINDLLGGAGSYLLTPGQVRRPASAAQPTITHALFERLQVNAGGSSDAITFAGPTPGQLVTLNGGGGNDVITVGDGSMSAFDLAGSTLISGGPGANTLIFNDSAAPGDAVYTLNPTSLTRSGMPAISFEFSQNVVLNAQTGNNSIEFHGSAAGVATTVNGGQGTDTMIMFAPAGGPLVFNGGTVNSPEDLLLLTNGATYTFNADANVGTTAMHVWVSGGSSVQFNTSQHLKGLGNSGNVTLASAAQPLVLSTTYLSGMFGGPFGRLDLTNGYAVVNYEDPNANPVDELRGYLASGYNGGAWNGQGMNSSVAAVTPNRAIGIAHSTHLFGGFPATFAGESIDSTTVLMSYTLYGDANLSRNVDVADLGILASNWQGTPRIWGQGDFDYNGAVNVGDLGILATNWQASIAGAAPASGAAPATPFRTTPRTATRLVEGLI